MHQVYQQIYESESPADIVEHVATTPEPWEDIQVNQRLPDYRIIAKKTRDKRYSCRWNFTEHSHIGYSHQHCPDNIDRFFLFFLVLI